MTGKIEAAVGWLLDGERKAGQALVPQLKTKFGLSASDAIVALRRARVIEGNRIRLAQRTGRNQP